MIDPPKHIRGDARRAWKRLAAAVGPRLNHATADAFEVLVRTWTNYQAVCEAVQELGPGGAVHTNSNGMVGIHPLEKIRHTRHGEMAAQLKQWGLTPASADAAGEFESDEAIARQIAFDKFLAGGDRPPPQTYGERLQEHRDFEAL